VAEPKTAAARLLASRPVEGNPPRVAARAAVDLDGIKLPKGYRPRAEEPYMSPKHLLYFRNKLEAWREELIEESQETLEHLRTETRDVGDEAERASRESDNILELRTRDRYRKLLRKIEQALERIDDGSYGYCEETGEEIGLARLEARPIATLTVDAQERRELVQRQYRDER
jgi:DnaK suppressor protein